MQYNVPVRYKLTLASRQLHCALGTALVVWYCTQTLVSLNN
jgi:hypothetical protein